MDIGKHFNLAELTLSQTAVRKGISNAPGEQEIASLRALVANILDPLREMLGKPIHVTSGFRSVALNRAIGGAATSQHCLGQAADIHVEGKSVAELAEYIRNSTLPYDQLIDEFGQWVHVSYGPRHRREFLTARSNGGHTVYAHG